MTWLAAVGFVAAMLLMTRALLLRRDDAVMSRLPGLRSDPAPRELLSSVGRRLIPAGRRTAARLAAVGRSDELDRVLGIKATLAAAGVGLGVTTWGPAPTALIGSVVMAAGGWIGPDLILARQVRAWRRRITAAVPEALDLVALAVGAGLSPRLALDRATVFVAGPLGEELRRARREVALGLPWERALRAMAERTEDRAVGRLAATLARGRRLGTPLVGPLRTLAIEVRAEDRARAEEEARRAPVVMLFPLVLCVLPAFVVAAVVPAVVVAIRGL
jgi:tight adherence protein C